MQVYISLKKLCYYFVSGRLLIWIPLDLLEGAWSTSFSTFDLRPIRRILFSSLGFPAFLYSYSVNNRHILTSHVLPKNTNINTYIINILPVVYMGVKLGSPY